MDTYMDGWMDGWMDGCLCVVLHIHCTAAAAAVNSANSDY